MLPTSTSRKTRLYYHPACLKHNPGPDRSFAPARLQKIVTALRNEKFKKLAWHEGAAATPEILELAHTPEYIAKVLVPIPEGEDIAFDFETFATSGTACAASHASGQVLAATEAVISGVARNAFCLANPGGHHAEADGASGYCFFNHVALAAIAAQKNLKQKRVAVLDFDAHHGNGTQSLFWNFADRLYISLHEDNPLSGFAHETGAWQNIMNVPLPTGSNGDVFRQAMEEKALPKIQAFAPDILFVSAGFDMHKDDPLSSMLLEANDYALLGKRLSAFADSVCQGKLVTVMEGGYNLEALAASAANFVFGLMDISA